MRDLIFVRQEIEVDSHGVPWAASLAVGKVAPRTCRKCEGKGWAGCRECGFCPYCCRCHRGYQVEK